MVVRGVDKYFKLEVRELPVVAFRIYIRSIQIQYYRKENYFYNSVKGNSTVMNQLIIYSTLCIYVISHELDMEVSYTTDILK